RARRVACREGDRAERVVGAELELRAELERAFELRLRLLPLAVSKKAEAENGARIGVIGVLREHLLRGERRVDLVLVRVVRPRKLREEIEIIGLLLDAELEIEKLLLGERRHVARLANPTLEPDEETAIELLGADLERIAEDLLGRLPLAVAGKELLDLLESPGEPDVVDDETALEVGDQDLHRILRLREPGVEVPDRQKPAGAETVGDLAREVPLPARIVAPFLVDAQSLGEPTRDAVVGRLERHDVRELMERDGAPVLRQRLGGRERDDLAEARARCGHASEPDDPRREPLMLRED